MSALSTSPDRRVRLGRLLAENGLLIALFVLMLLFSALNSRFLTLDNIGTLLEQNAPILLVSVGMTFAIISRHIDLSPASIIALIGVVIAGVTGATGSLLIGIVVGFAAAIAVELFNAVLIVRAGINPLIVTLACWIW
ncbi:hypothetical protein QQ056_17935, partial [Oscillatoria laete-virens NRMC-F 0139]